MVISQEGYDLIKYVAQAAVVVPIIAGPAWHFLPSPPGGRKEKLIPWWTETRAIGPERVL
jgi:hypothetical protein